MDGISDLMSALDSSTLDDEVKSYLKDVVVAYVDGKGAVVMDAILDLHTKEHSA